MTRRAVVVGLALAATLATAGCKKAGGSCTGNAQVCADKSDALLCKGGSFVPVACKGPLACSKYQDHVNCDTTVGSAGDNCMGEDDEYACSPDKKHAVVCKGGKFVPYLECRGGNGCTMDGRIVNCDLTLSEPGDPCKKEDVLACSDDAKQMLVCRLGKFQSYRFCRGQFGCTAKPEGPACDESLSQIGDPCGVAGQIVCSTDGTTELICQGTTYAKSRTCKTDCKIVTTSGRHVECN